MCGIAGILSKAPNSVTVQSLKRMTDAIEHRGPDGEGQWINAKGNLGLAHRRLSILDLSELGKQPMHYRERYTLTFNGEIYNYIEIRDQLLVQGYTFASDTDSEVLIAAYDAYGRKCLDHFDGMFAFALYDSQEETLFCARDRFGEKPFYYTIDGDSFLFASEMKALWAMDVSRELDDEVVYNYLVTGNVGVSDRRRTMYQGIYTLQPAHSLSLSVGQWQKVEQQRYWDVSTSTTITDSGQAIEEFRSLFDTSVLRRLRSDVPVGSSLSGGLDSSLVVTTMAQLGQDITQNTFSAAFPGHPRDESRYQEMIVAQVKSKHYTTTPSVSRNIGLLDRVMQHQEMPYGSTSVHLQYQVFEMARAAGVIVLLDGQGADEVMGGYSHSTLSRLYALMRAGKVGQAWALAGASKERQAKSMKYLLGGAVSGFLPKSIVGQLRSNGEGRARGMLNEDFVQQWAGSVAEDVVVFDSLNAALYHQTMVEGLGKLLRYCDRNAMAHSVEVRLPFLSADLVQRVFQMAPDIKIHDGWTKWIARKAAEGRVPDEIIWRTEKVAYESPDNHLYNSRKNESIQALLREPELGKYFNSKEPSTPKQFFRKVMLAEMINHKNNEGVLIKR